MITTIPETSYLEASSHVPLQLAAADHYLYVMREVNSYTVWHEHLKLVHYDKHPVLRTLFNRLAEFSMPGTFNLKKLSQTLENLEPFKVFIQSVYKEATMVQEFNSQEMNEFTSQYLELQSRFYNMVVLYGQIDKEKLKKNSVLNELFNKLAFYHHPATYNSKELSNILNEFIKYGKELNSVMYSARP